MTMVLSNHSSTKCFIYLSIFACNYYLISISFISSKSEYLYFLSSIYHFSLHVILQLFIYCGFLMVNIENVLVYYAVK